MEFVKKTFPYGFAKYKNSRGTSRPYFESIAIGSLLAIREDSRCTAKDIGWANLDKNAPNDFYMLLSGRYHTHKPNKLRQRIEYVANKLLGR